MRTSRSGWQLVLLAVVLLVKESAHLEQSIGTSSEIDRRATVLDSVTNGSPEREPRLADDYLYVYLDVGANIGVHTRFLFEPNQCPEALTALNIFSNNFGVKRDNRDICSFGFEPNPAHKKRHEELERVYSNMGWRYKYIQAGAIDQEGNLTFWHSMTENSLSHVEWGFSTFKSTPNALPEIVPLVHLSKWIQYHITERRIPTQIYGNYNSQTRNEGKVVMKLDIEGSEFSVLPNLMFTGALCKGVDFAFGEQHPEYGRRFERPALDKNTGRGALKPGDHGQARNFMNGLVGDAFMSVHPKDCKTTWRFLDDESYLHDGTLFPPLKPHHEWLEAYI